MAQRTFTFNFVVPDNMPAGQREFKTTLPSDFAQATGFAVYTNSGTTPYKIGLRDDLAVYVDPTNSAYFEASKDCPKDQRLTKCPIPANGRQLVVLIELLSDAHDALNIDVVFNMEGLKGER